MPSRPDIEFKSFKVNIDPEEIKDTGEFEGYSAVFSQEDLTGDIIEPGAFKRTLDHHDSFPYLWQHNPYEPIGMFSARETDRGLRIIGKLNMDVARAKECRALMRQGALKGMSIGYTPIQYHYDDEGRRHLTEIKLWEASSVTFPAMPEAQVGQVKGLPPQEQPVSQTALLQLIGATRSATSLIEVDHKAGRVLSAANRALVLEAIQAIDDVRDVLEALLQRADQPPEGSGDQGKSEEEPDTKDAQGSADGEPGQEEDSDPEYDSLIQELRRIREGDPQEG